MREGHTLAILETGFLGKMLVKSVQFSCMGLDFWVENENGSVRFPIQSWPRALKLRIATAVPEFDICTDISSGVV